MQLTMNRFRRNQDDGDVENAEDVQAPAPEEERRPRERTRPAARPQGHTEWKQSSKPRVVLLPTKDRAASTMRRSLRNAGIVSAAMLAATVIAYMVVAGSASGAQSELDTHKELKAQHQAYLTGKQDIRDYVKGMEERKSAAAQVLLPDTDFSRIIAEIEGANAVGATLTDVSAGVTEDVLSPRPFGMSTAVGYMNISGKVGSISDVGRFVGALNARGAMLTDAYATSAMNVGEAVEFSITVGYTEEAYSFKGVAFDPESAAAAEEQAETPAPKEAAAPAQQEEPNETLLEEEDQ